MSTGIEIESKAEIAKNKETKCRIVQAMDDGVFTTKVAAQIAELKRRTTTGARTDQAQRKDSWQKWTL